MGAIDIAADPATTGKFFEPEAMVVVHSSHRRRVCCHG
jgi:hypothetical protein